MRSRVHSAAARANPLNHSRSSKPATPCSWLPATIARARRSRISTHAPGSAPYPTLSPRQSTPSARDEASASTARSASRLPWTSDRMAYLTGGAYSGGTQLPIDPVEHTIDEATRFAGAELLRDLDGFVDGDLGRHARLAEQLVHGDAQNVAVDDGHTLQIPVLRRLRDDGVDLRLLQLGAAHKRSRERPRLLVHRMTLPEVGLERRGVGGARLVELIEELQRDLPSLAPLSHGPSAISRMRSSPAPPPPPPLRGSPRRRRRAPTLAPRSAR